MMNKKPTKLDQILICFGIFFSLGRQFDANGDCWQLLGREEHEMDTPPQGIKTYFPTNFLMELELQ